MKSPDKTITFADAVEFLAARVRKPGDEEREAKDRVRQRLTYAIKTGQLVTLDGTKVGPSLFSMNSFAAWAHSKWPGKLPDLPYPPITANVRIPLPVLHIRATGYCIPNNLADCQTALADVEKERIRLHAELVEARNEIDQLRPLAEAQKNLRARNQQNARRKRNRRS
jgi:hypothetical protein